MYFSLAYRLTCESLQIIFAIVIIQHCSTNCSLQHVTQWVDAFGSHASNLEFCPGLHNHRTFEFRPGSEFCQGSESLKGKYVRQSLRPLMRGSRALYYMYISYSHTLDCLHLRSDYERRFFFCQYAAIAIQQPHFFRDALFSKQATTQEVFDTDIYVHTQVLVFISSTPHLNPKAWITHKTYFQTEFYQWQVHHFGKAGWDPSTWNFHYSNVNARSASWQGRYQTKRTAPVTEFAH